MISRTLSFYFGRHFFKIVISIFALFFFVIMAVTYIEFFNRAFKGETIPGFALALAALFRVPSLAEESIPFAVLYGSITAFVIANRRLEVVVARAAGVSAWQFLLPATLVGLICGVIATGIYNPLSSSLLSLSNRLGSQLTIAAVGVSAPVDQGSVWARQKAAGRESIIGAAQSFDQGFGLSGVTAFVYDDKGTFIERVDSGRAQYTQGAWRLENATVTAPGSIPERQDVYNLPTNLTPGEVQGTFRQINTIPVWDFPNLIRTAQRAGMPTSRFELRYNALLSRPILLLAMVLIAAIVSLRFSRSRDLGRMIITGVAIGFMLYVLMKIAWDLGSGGIVPPTLAAWLPAIVATLMGVTVLLHLEDG